MTDPTPRRRGRPTLIKPVKQYVTSGHEPQMTDGLTVGRNVTQTQTTDRSSSNRFNSSFG
jgi:hypothetical protein